MGNCGDTTNMQTWKLDDLNREQQQIDNSPEPRHTSGLESTDEASAQVTRDFSYAEGSLLEQARLLSQQMPGARDAISQKALAFEVPSKDLLFHTIDDGRYTRKIYKR